MTAPRSAFWPMLRKEFIQMRRDRLTLAMMVVLPAVQLVLFGYAIRTEVRHLRTIVLDESATAESRALVTVLANTHNFDITGYAVSRGEVERYISSGRASAALVIPPDFGTDIKRGRTAHAQVIVDAADPLASQAALAGAALAGAARAADISAARTGRGPPLQVDVRPRYNPAMRSSSYIVPGIVGILLSITMIVITAMAIVRERERGTLEQLIVTPIGRSSIMFGKLVPFMVVGYIQMSVVLFLGKLLFDIPIRGSLLLLYAITLSFIVASLAIGLVVSTRVRNQVQSMQLGFFFILPTILLSGFMFPREAMPKFAQWLGLVIPLTHYLKVLRGILLKGIGIEHLWREVLSLAGIATLLVLIAVRRFTKTLE